MALVSCFIHLLLIARLAASLPALDVLDLQGIGKVHWPDGRPLPLRVTKTSSGQYLAWIKPDEQEPNGILATPPAVTLLHEISEVEHPKSELEDSERGPNGTVPILVTPIERLQKHPQRRPRPVPGKVLVARDFPGHYYAFTGVERKNFGGSSTVSMFSPSVARSDSMSLLEIAAVNTQQGYQQTAEVGWQVLPDIYGDSNPHVFTYFTTNGFAKEGNKKGGYNTMYHGFVQTSSNFFPGMTFSRHSTTGGKQHEIALQSHFHNGNWWIQVHKEWIGYYPGSLYAKHKSKKRTLGHEADSLLFYGETYDNPEYAPTSDMGSGQFAEAGYGQAAYQHSLKIHHHKKGKKKAYKGHVENNTPDWFTIAANFESGSSWGSYFYVGGPGAG